MKPNMKEAYSDGNKKKKFKRVSDLIQSGGKAQSEANASKNPMAALKDKSYLNIKGKKGVAV